MELSLEILKNRNIRWGVFGAFAVLGLIITALGYVLHYPDFMFHLYIAVGLIVVLSPMALYSLWDERKKNQIDSMLPRLLEDVAEGQESGLTLLKSFELSSQRNYGPLSRELRQMVAQLTWGVEFEDALRLFSERIDTELTTKITILLIEAMKLGGDLKNTFHSTASFVREMTQLRDERESQLKPYMMIIYISVVVFMIIIIILYQSFFLSMAQGGSGTGFMTLPVSLEVYKVLLFDLVVIEAFFGGITAGKLSGGRISSGLKHSVSLILVVLVVFGMFFLDPVAPNITDLDYSPLSPTAGNAVDITVVVKDPFPGSGIEDAYLIWSDDGWATSRRIEMEYNQLDELWEAQIPPRGVGTSVLFFVEAADTSGNLAVNDNAGGYFGYTVVE